MRGGDRVEIRRFDYGPQGPRDSFGGMCGTITAVRTQRGEVGYLVLLDGLDSSIYFGPDRLIPIAEECHHGGAE